MTQQGAYFMTGTEFYQERRSDDPMVTRIIILETKVEDQTQKLDKFFEKLDNHIKDETEADTRLRDGVQNLTKELAKTNENLTIINDNVSGLKMKQVQFDTAWATIVKIAGIIVVLTSGGWAVFEYLHRSMG